MTGKSETTKEFEAVERKDEHLWIELREGEKEGLQYAVPDEGVASEIDVGYIGKLKVESLNEKNTAWRVVDVCS